MAAPVRVNHGAALLGAARGILPYAILFYVIDFFIWYSNAPGRANDANLVSNILISSAFVGGFFLINFFRIRKAQKSALEARAAPRVVYVQQPVYVQGPPPGYPYPGYAPPPGYPTYGYPPYPAPPPGALPAPQPAEPVPTQEPPEPVPPPPPARKRPPGGPQ